MEKRTIHDMEPEEVFYLILHRGLHLNEFELQYGEIYPHEDLKKVPQHTIIGMIMAGWIYRGSMEDVERMKKSRLQGDKISASTVNQEKKMQVKEVKKMIKNNA